MPGLLPRHASGFRRLAQHGQRRLGLGRRAPLLREIRAPRRARRAALQASARSTSRTSRRSCTRRARYGSRPRGNSGCRSRMTSMARIPRDSAATRSRFATASAGRRPTRFCALPCAGPTSHSRRMRGCAKSASRAAARSAWNSSAADRCTRLRQPAKSSCAAAPSIHRSCCSCPGSGPASCSRVSASRYCSTTPSVGGNLQDHLAVSYSFKATQPTVNDELTLRYARFHAALRYLFARGGPLSLSVNQFGGFARADPAASRPDVQLYFNPVTYGRAMRIAHAHRARSVPGLHFVLSADAAHEPRPHRHREYGLPSGARDRAELPVDRTRTSSTSFTADC
jgi:hypothetical protein